MTSGCMSASLVSSQTDPVQAPCAPSAIAAAIWRPSAMPPAASTGTSGPTVSTTCGTSTIVEISPQWPPASVPCATMTSTPRLTWRSACCLLPTSPPTSTPWAWACSMMYGGGGPRALTIIFTLGCESVTSTWPGPSSSTFRPAALRTPRSKSSGRGGIPASVSTLSTNWRCSSGMREARCSGRRVRTAALADVLHGHGEVDPVGLAVHVVVDPVELDLEPLGLEGEGAEHAEAAGVGHGGDDVAAVAEGEDRELDAESFADRCAHGDDLQVIDPMIA